MKLPIKKGWLITVGIIIIFMALNPTLKDFDEYIGDGYRHRRINNFLLFSIYRGGGKYAGEDGLYLGFLKNFIFIRYTYN